MTGARFGGSRSSAIDADDTTDARDSPEDIRAANRLGIPGCLVRTGWAADPSIAATVGVEATHVATSIVDAVDWILSFHART
jgi:hypothetical protein